MAPRTVVHELPAGMPRPLLSRGQWTWGVSLVVHVAAIVVGGEWALRSLAQRTPRVNDEATEHVVSLELPPMAESTLVAQANVATRDPIGEVPRVSGGPTVPRIDTGRDGHGGDRTVSSAATHLADVDEQMQLSRGTINRSDRDQTQRIRVDTTRTTREDRRSSREPMELAFLSSGELARMERRAPSDHDPSRGALVSRTASAAGGALGAAARTGENVEGLAGTGHAGTSVAEPGHGVRDGVAGLDHRTGAAVTHARPDVAFAAVSVEAPNKGRPTDNVDSEQELAAKVQALVHASTAGGVVGTEGIGGSGGGGAAGAGGLLGAGSHPAPLGDGMGDWFDVTSTDPRIIAYFRRFHAKVDPLWVNAFPKSAIFELKQGTVILEVTIAADGTARVAWPPARASGVPEFDRNCADAVRKASPFDPIPPELGLTVLHLRAPFVAINPIVH